MIKSIASYLFIGPDRSGVFLVSKNKKCVMQKVNGKKNESVAIQKVNPGERQGEWEAGEGENDII